MVRQESLRQPVLAFQQEPLALQLRESCREANHQPLGPLEQQQALSPQHESCRVAIHQLERLGQRLPLVWPQRLESYPKVNHHRPPVQRQEPVLWRLALLRRELPPSLASEHQRQ